jgi:putative ABC transport system substrate-binding protein
MHKKFRIRFGFSHSDNRKSKIENLKLVGLSVIAFVLVVTGAVAQAQQAAKVPRIGALLDNAMSPGVEAFRQGLKDLAYIEGKNIVIEYRYAEGNYNRLPDLAADLVRQKVEVIVAQGSPASEAAKQATKIIPIVFLAVGDPVGSKFVATLAHPGGNITGLTNMTVDLSGKQLELLKEALPTIKTVAVLWNPGNPVTALQLKEAQVAAHSLLVELQLREARDSKGIDDAFSAMIRGRANAVLLLADPMLATERKRIAGLAIKSRLPIIGWNGVFVEGGGLMSYGPIGTDIWRRAATYVDKILKGTKPADLPVEQPTKFELVINLKTAKQIGVTIPPNVLARADKVIK